ncbi:hypothetical protein B6E66_01405 [Streptomyces maremycinicus]|nr:hypothetical protein B6E66_01405 [Streptomyces sp. B9173]
MEPVIVGAVVTVAVSVVNAVAKIAQRRLNVSVEIARITETAQTERVRFLTGRAVPAAPYRPGRLDAAGPVHRSGGDDHGGRPRR